MVLWLIMLLQDLEALRSRLMLSIQNSEGFGLM